jgi:hypothetical protein
MKRWQLSSITTGLILGIPTLIWFVLDKLFSWCVENYAYEALSRGWHQAAVWIAWAPGFIFAALLSDALSTRLRRTSAADL